MAKWDKYRKRYEAEKMAERVMDSPVFKEAMRQQEERAVLNALARFTFIMCGFLETRYGYKKEGLKKFLQFVGKSLDETGDNDDFFIGYDEYYKEEYDLDVLGELGLGLEEK